MSKLILAFATAMALTSGVAGAAHAQQSQTFSGRVYYGDLELASGAGARTMFRRIQREAEGLCAPSHSPVIGPAPLPSEVTQCRLDAVRRAVGDLQSPFVTAEFQRTWSYPGILASR